MTEYVIRRLLWGALTCVLVSLIVFALLRIAPGDVVDQILGGEGEFYSQETYNSLRKELGLDRPLHMQYLVFMRDFVTLQWGNSIYTKKPIWPEVRAKMPVTLQLALSTVLFSISLGIPAGVIMALKQDQWPDYIVRLTSLLGLSVPNFWTGTLIILAGVLFFNWSPRLQYVSPFDDLRANFIMFIWPAVATGWVSQATKARMMRSTMLEVLRQDYIRTAHAKGLTSFVVTYRHAMKNALIPVITIIGVQIAVILGGSVIMETIFLLPGMGRYFVSSLGNKDYPVVQTLTLVFSLWIVLANLLVDLSYGLLDPRIRFD